MLNLDPITLVVIAVAAILGWRLWSVLGQRTGYERKFPGESEPGAKSKVVEPVADVELPAPKAQTRHAEPGTPLYQALVEIGNRDRSFDADHFLSGASKAYEMINESFAKGDKASLSRLLSRDVLKEFALDIDRMKGAGELMAWQLVKIEKIDLKQASLQGNLACITVNIVASVISATTSKAGETVEGHTTAIERVEDDWTFERNISSSDPNWKLSATTSA